MTTTLPPDVAEIVEAARLQGLAEGYHYGYDAALDFVAAGHAELDILVGPTWRTNAVDSVTARRARERVEREQHAGEAEAARNIAAGRRPGYRYRGGAVDWSTGLPAGSACAWLRNRRLRDAAQMATVTTLSPRPERLANRQVAA